MGAEGPLNSLKKGTTAPLLAMEACAWRSLQTFHLSDHDIGKKEGLESYATALAEKARELAKPGTNTIRFLNTVARAQAVYAALRRANGALPSLLVHSRFRAKGRMWRRRGDRTLQLIYRMPD